MRRYENLGLQDTTTVPESFHENHSSEEIFLEMLSSFSLGGITPFIEGDAHETLLLHRLRSKWSSEGRLETRTIEDLLLEPSWSEHGMQSERFGQQGSMPVRGFFPFAAIEDQKNRVVWAAQLACASSWQLEVYRRDNALCFSGGLGDYDFAHWRKKLLPGEAFKTPFAYVTVCSGQLDDACSRLVNAQRQEQRELQTFKCLPVFFNEFCTTWGIPSQENITQILTSIKNRDIDYFIIDAGWYADEVKGWQANMGDWEVSERLFPQGLGETVRRIKEVGLIPGIWFELEICGRDAKAFYYEDHLLKRNGKVITAGTRRFWNMRDEWTIEYLSQKVIEFLKKYGFKYIKIDYNENIGIGCDGTESLGEGLRQQILATQEFLRKIRREIPDIVIENCASGGHRLEPSMMALSEFASFSDAHEQKEIPIIAANLHRVMLPEQSLIWVVLHATDTPEQIRYLLTAAFLGVLTLSGIVYDLTEMQWKVIQEGIAFYRRIAPLIQNGKSMLYQSGLSSYRHPVGWQAVVRTNMQREEAYVVVHLFAEPFERRIAIPLQGEWQIAGVYSSEHMKISLKQETLFIESPVGTQFEGVGIHLKK